MPVFTELTIIIVLAAVMAVLMRILRQPIIIGHILTGIIAGPMVFDLVKSRELFQVMSELGIAFLLFIVGIALNSRVIKEVGKASVLTGLGQIVFTSLVGYLLARLLGFETVVSLYLGVALTFSSTIIVLKLLSDKLALEKLYGRIAIGFLIVQDVVAVVILIVISSISGSDSGALGASLAVLRGAILVAILLFLSRLILPKLGKFFARQQELLFLFAIAWGLGLAALFQALGFSIEIGALAAGVSLAALPYSVEISARLKPLRDFFIVVFFILLGGQMVVINLAGFIWPVAVFSIFILIGNPLIVIWIMSRLGYSRRTGFLAGLTVAQISEFSLLLIMLGIRHGHLEPFILSLVTAVGLLTIAGSSYMIMYAEKIYAWLEPWLNPGRLNTSPERQPDSGFSTNTEALLFGLNRIGYDFLASFQEHKLKFMVVDFNPDVIRQLSSQGIACQYGDAEDSEFLDSLPLASVKLVVSTIPDFNANALLIDKIRQVNKRAVIMALNHSILEALDLYKRGASYVVLPHFLGGRLAAELVVKYGDDLKKYRQASAKQIKDLRHRLALGQEHPVLEKLRL